MEYIYTYGNEAMEENLQTGKAVLLTRLHNEGHIDNDVYEDYMENYGLIIRKPSFFSSIWGKLTNKGEEERERLVLVKQFSFLRVDRKDEKDGDTEEA